MNLVSSLDIMIFNEISAIRNPWLTDIMKFFTTIGSTQQIIIIVFIIIFLMYRYMHSPKPAACFFTFSLLGSLLLSTIIKHSVQRIRPQILPWLIIPEDPYSFPSGHTVCGIALYWALLYLIYNEIIPCKYKKTCCFSLLLFPLFIAISRVYLGVHYFSDIIGGILLASTYLLILIKCFKFKK